jgi:hypothetical protein
MIGFRFPERARNIFLLYSVENSSGTHPPFYRMGTGDSFPRGKEART